MTESDLTELEKVDKILLRRVLETPSSTPREMLYLELCASPIRNIIISRRLNFLHYILQKDDNSLIKQWKKDITLFDINLTLEEIEQMRKQSFKKLVKVKEKQNTLEECNKLKIKHSKVAHVKHTELDL